MTPYLILDGEIEAALKFAAERGVEVALILPFFLPYCFFRDLSAFCKGRLEIRFDFRNAVRIVQMIDHERFLSFPTMPVETAKGYVIPYGDRPLDDDKLGDNV